MLAGMKTHPIKSNSSSLRMRYGRNVYQFPIRVAEKYRIKEELIPAEEVFAALDAKYTKAGALFGGLRFRENLTQVEMAKMLKVTQSDISQMEHGKRKIGLKMAKRIAKLFDVDGQSFISV
jgi:DNA-binding XRE family transcriptional regulator